jgi:hypothetical protein
MRFQAISGIHILECGYNYLEEQPCRWMSASAVA